MWEDFESIKHGIQKEDIQELKKECLLMPNSLIRMLEYVDGTYWREYNGREISFYFLGSDVFEYPYYIFSSKQILEKNM